MQHKGNFTMNLGLWLRMHPWISSRDSAEFYIKLHRMGNGENMKVISSSLYASITSQNFAVFTFFSITSYQYMHFQNIQQDKKRH